MGRERRLGQEGEQEAFVFHFADREIPARPGETVGAALLAADIRLLRRAEDGGPRGLFCGIGVCWECRCVIDSRPNTRACMVEAKPGMTVRLQDGLS